MNETEVLVDQERGVVVTADVIASDGTLAIMANGKDIAYVRIDDEGVEVAIAGRDCATAVLHRYGQALQRAGKDLK